MALFKRKKDNFIDLTDSGSLKASPKLKPSTSSSFSSQQSNDDFIFPADFNPSSQFPESHPTPSDYVDVTDSVEERRKKLTKRIMDMTSKMEELSNQIYHLQQRLEVIERKMNINSFE